MKIRVFALLLIFSVFAASCAAKTETPTAETAAAPTAEATATASVDVNSEECVACHTDKQKLIDTAAPVVEAEGESKGVG